MDVPAALSMRFDWRKRLQSNILDVNFRYRRSRRFDKVAREERLNVYHHMRLRKHRSREARADTGRHSDRLWLYGRHAVNAALANTERHCHRLMATDAMIAEMKRRLGEAPRDGSLEIAVVARDELGRVLPAGAVHQGVALEVAPLTDPALDAACMPPPGAAPSATVVVLDRVTDPQNVGAVLRAAAAFGALAVVMPERHAPRESGALAKAASGALETVPLVRVTNLARALDHLKRLGYWCMGLEAGASETIAEANPRGAIALVLGAEGEGLRRLTRERCDLHVRLPISESVESLNVASAAAVALYALAHPA